MNGYFKQLCEVLTKNGWAYYGPGKGSHQKWRKSGISHSVLVPFNCYSRHTANAVLREAGIDHKF
jgi:predicted RNA binding protein YcfA (HicA-like mRNA interferase family)